MADQYIWSPVYIDAMIERDTPSQRLYVQQDGNWNVTSILDTSGNVQERYVYDPFGVFTILAPNWAIRGASSFAWVFLYQGGRYDNNTGLYYFRNRDYSASLGRWMQNDPIGFENGDSNTYEYLLNKPSSLLDPLGLAPIQKGTPPNQGVFEADGPKPYRPPDKPGNQGGSITITFIPKICIHCSEIAFIQLVKTTDANGDVIYAHPHHGYRDPGNGWIVDRPYNNVSPWYGYYNPGGGLPRITPGAMSGNSSKPAQLPDHPNFSGVHKMTLETCAICKSGDDQGQIYGCVTWGYQYDANGNFKPIAPEQHPKPSENWWPAIDAWNNQCKSGPKKDNGGGVYKQMPIDLPRPKGS